jgi:uncharacterized protein (TIGR02246 family)
VNQPHPAVAGHLDAIRNRDLDAYVATLHEDVLVVLPTGTRFEGRAAVTEFHRDFFADPDWTQAMTEVRFVATDATVSALYEAEYRDVDPAGVPFTSRFLVGLVFVRAGDGWLLLHDQCTPLADATPA